MDVPSGAGSLRSTRARTATPASSPIPPNSVYTDLARTATQHGAVLVLGGAGYIGSICTEVHQPTTCSSRE